LLEKHGFIEVSRGLFVPKQTGGICPNCIGENSVCHNKQRIEGGEIYTGSDYGKKISSFEGSPRKKKTYPQGGGARWGKKRGGKTIHRKSPS